MDEWMCGQHLVDEVGVSDVGHTGVVDHGDQGVEGARLGTFISWDTHGPSRSLRHLNQAKVAHIFVSFT